jgi:regulator of microtubule dynamics protein 3
LNIYPAIFRYYILIQCRYILLTEQSNFRNLGVDSNFVGDALLAIMIGDKVKFLGKMDRVGIIICLMSICFFSVAQTESLQTYQSLMATGDSLFDKGDFAGAAILFEKATYTDSLSFNAYWKTGNSLNYLGETVSPDSELAIFEKARTAEEKALKLNNANADAHFQLARALGKIALHKGVFSSIGLAKQVKREADKALALDSLHDGAWHILARWHREIAKKPMIFRGPLGLGDANKHDAVVFMQKAISLRPNYINHHLEMGITYQDYGDRDKAQEEYQKCLTLPAQGPLDKKYKEEAKKYLASMDKN